MGAARLSFSKRAPAFALAISFTYHKPPHAVDHYSPAM
jgi:hypothetical protein